MSAGRSKRERKQESAIAALLTERTHADAAVKAGIAEATLQRWLRLPAFLTDYRYARRVIVETAIANLQRDAGDADETLRRNLTCGNPNAEIRAAATILEQAIKGVELADLVDEVEKLKALFAEREAP